MNRARHARRSDGPTRLGLARAHSAMEFQICLLRAARGVHSEAFREIAESLCFALRRIGHRSSIVENRLDGAGTKILLGAHFLAAGEAPKLDPSVIVYNLEQISGAKAASSEHYFELLRRCRVWDYSPRNIAAYAKLGLGIEAALMPIGFVAELERIAAAREQDIDVLFYGSLNERRNAILEEVRGTGLNTKVVFGVYGPARDELIARSKVVLNLHFYDTRIFELPRVSFLLANRKAVVSEWSEETEIDEDLKEALRLAPARDIADACVELVFDGAARSALEAVGYERFSARRLEDSVRALLGEGQRAAPVARYPLKLNLGSGKDWRDDYLNLDLDAKWRVDGLLDICRPLELPGPSLDTRRFGTLALHEHMFDEIIANDVLEHLPDLVTAMTNCLRLLKPGGVLRAKVPYDLSYGAWQDPTHLRAFNERSWLYYSDWYWYLGWDSCRFDVENLRYGLSPIGRALSDRGTPMEEILRTPRAVDDMCVDLRKRFLSEEEARTGARIRDIGIAAAAQDARGAP